MPIKNALKFTAYVESLGCAPNQADAEKIIFILIQKGWTLSPTPKDADIIIVLTCGFTQQMEAANRNRLAELAAMVSGGTRFFVGGCLPAISNSNLDLPENCVIFGPTSLDLVENEINSLSKNVDLKIVGVTSTATEVKLIRIATGCMSRCTYCAIPMACGKTHSRPSSEVVNDINALIVQGIQNFRLTSEDVGSYGVDVEKSYVVLLKEILAGTTANLIWLDTLNPKWLYKWLPETIDLLRNRRIGNLLYIPIQSGSDKVLKKMGRGYTIKEVREVLTSLQTNIPDIRITTDLLVGFPGETEKDFQQTRQLLCDFSFDFIEVFEYTERQGTPAAHFGNSVPIEVRAQRAKQLLSDIFEAKLRKQNIFNRDDLLKYLNNNDKLPINTNTSLKP